MKKVTIKRDVVLKDCWRSKCGKHLHVINANGSHSVLLNIVLSRTSEYVRGKLVDYVSYRCTGRFDVIQGGKCQSESISKSQYS